MPSAQGKYLLAGSSNASSACMIALSTVIVLSRDEPVEGGDELVTCSHKHDFPEGNRRWGRRALPHSPYKR